MKINNVKSIIEKIYVFVIMGVNVLWMKFRKVI